jgi:hypothetical protein
MDGVEIHGNYGLPTLAVVVDSMKTNIQCNLKNKLILFKYPANNLNHMGKNNIIFLFYWYAYNVEL